MELAEVVFLVTSNLESERCMAERAGMDFELCHPDLYLNDVDVLMKILFILKNSSEKNPFRFFVWFSFFFNKKSLHQTFHKIQLHGVNKLVSVKNYS